LKIRCNSKGNDLRISIRWLDKFHADHFISDQAKSILTKLGFNPDNYEMIIENFNASNISSLIEKLAIIMFDGFELIGNKTINVRYK
jgi:hypothetical protein